MRKSVSKHVCVCVCARARVHAHVHSHLSGQRAEVPKAWTHTGDGLERGLRRPGVPAHQGTREVGLVSQSQALPALPSREQ